TTAAKWNTGEAPCTIDCTVATLAISPATAFTRGSSRPGPLTLPTSNSRSSLTVAGLPSRPASVPCWRMRRASFLPRKPAPPVITTFMSFSARSFFAAESVHRSAASVYVGGTMRIISWNLLRLEGAAVGDVVALLERERPDVLLMQEVTQHMDALPSLTSGHYHRLPWPGRIHGLAVWSRYHFSQPHVLPLPASRLPGRVPRRR